MMRFIAVLFLIAVTLNLAYMILHTMLAFTVQLVLIGSLALIFFWIIRRILNDDTPVQM